MFFKSARFVLRAIAVALFFSSWITFANADDKLERATAKSLIELVTNQGPDQAKEAESAFLSISNGSPFKAIAAQALALIELQQGHWTEAGKLLASHKPNGSASSSVKLGHEKLLLWIALESNAAEPQFNRFVGIATNKNLPEPERREAYLFLGGVLGMLESGKETMGIRPTNIVENRSKVTATESKAANDLFQQAWKDAHQWGTTLVDQEAEFTKLGLEGAASVLKEHQEKRDDANNTQSQLKLDHESKKAKIDTLENETKILKLNQRSIQMELNNLLNSKPKQPTLPGVRPRSPRTVTNSKGEVDVAATNRERSEYERDMQAYDRKVTRYQQDLREYDSRLADWNQKVTVMRPQLEAKFQQLGAEIIAKEPVRKSLEEDAKRLAREILSGRKELDEANRAFQISTLAMEQLKEANSTPRPLLRPSHFNLLDHNNEMGRLEKSLRAP